MKIRSAVILASFFLLLTAALARAQEVTAPGQPAKLADLLAEAERNNPQIQAARHGWDSAKQVPTQVSTLPDPQFVLQQMNVGSPRPFSGYTNSDFAYVGLGVSQDLSYPGKLRLRGEISKKDADMTQQKYESVRRAILAEMKMAYFQLGYLAKRQTILVGDGDLLQQVEQSAEARYRNGMGNQQEVLQAQLERTKLLREITMNQLEAGKVQAEIKQLLNRLQSSPDIETIELSETGLSYTYDQLLAAASANNPEIAGAQRMVEKQGLQVDLAKKDFYPGLQPSIHVAAHRPYAVSRLLPVDARRPHSDLSWTTPTARTSSSRSGSEPREKRARSADTTNRLSASPVVLRGRKVG